MTTSRASSSALAFVEGVLMHYWIRRVFVAAAPLFLTGCLWGPGKFNSELTLHRDGTFVLDYRGEIVVQIPKDEYAPMRWSDSQAVCVDRQSGSGSLPVVIAPPPPAPPPPASAVKTPRRIIPPPNRRPCTPAEIAQQRAA